MCAMCNLNSSSYINSFNPKKNNFPSLPASVLDFTCPTVPFDLEFPEFLTFNKGFYLIIVLK